MTVGELKLKMTGIPDNYPVLLVAEKTRGRKGDTYNQVFVSVDAFWGPITGPFDQATCFAIEVGEELGNG